MDQLQDGHDGLGFLDLVLCSEAVPELWSCQQRHDGVSSSHGDVHLQVLPVSSASACQRAPGLITVRMS